MEPVVLAILDGVGLREAAAGNAVQAASTPTITPLLGDAAALSASGSAVGLPKGQAGNSEVGHLTIGAGRSVPQPLTRINRAIQNNTLEQRLQRLLGDASEHVHLLGLLSDGGVHAHYRHIEAVATLLEDNDVRPIIHVISDGRDTAPRNVRHYLTSLDETLETGVVSTVMGRYYAMDRDGNQGRTEAAVRAMRGEAEYSAQTSMEAVEMAYQRGESDEFVTPTTVYGSPPLSDGDNVLCCNFRADRMRQIVRAIAPTNPVTAMTPYDAGVETNVLFEPIYPEDTLGQCIAQADRKQLRVSESEKEAHVTYFFNGGRDTVFRGEQRVIHDSPAVETYESAPAMRAQAITDTVIAALREGAPPAFTLVTYANADMLGHTGDVDAAVESIEALDTAVERLLTVAENEGVTVLLTADHGNAEQMLVDGQTVTAHTDAPVPFAVGTGDYQLARKEGSLHDIAPTVLDMLAIQIPNAMTGISLVTAGN